MTRSDRFSDVHPLEPTAGELLATMAEAEAAATALPEALAARLIADGEAALRTQQDQQGQRAPLRALPATRRRPLLPWALAIAASLAWLLLPSPLRRGSDTPAVTPLAALRDSLAAMSGVQRVAWSATDDPAGRGVSGEVLWDPQAQRGVMRFVGLAPNDPRVAQYQLWIVDALRDARYPVDGGVFDVTSTGEVLVPIAARLPVGRATLFAVTLEVPGGVVVSNRERLVLAAPVEG